MALWHSKRKELFIWSYKITVTGVITVKCTPELIVFEAEGLMILESRSIFISKVSIERNFLAQLTAQITGYLHTKWGLQ